MDQVVAAKLGSCLGWSLSSGGVVDGTGKGLLLPGGVSCMHGASKVGGVVSGRGSEGLGWGGEQVLFEGEIGGDIGVCRGGSITPR